MERRLASLLLWTVIVGLVSQNIAIPLTSAGNEDQKTYYTPDPHAGSPPSGFSTNHEIYTHIPSHFVVQNYFLVLRNS